MDNNKQQKVIDVRSVFTHSFLDSRTLYMFYFKEVPSISFVDHINGEKAYQAVLEKYGALVQSTHCYRYYERSKAKAIFNDTLIVLNNGCLLEFDRGYCEILYRHANSAFVMELVDFVRTFRARQQAKLHEINLLFRDAGDLELKQMPVKKVNLDLDLYYEDDFKEVDKVIRQRLNTKNDKGIVLLHGLPGTGKTTYLRYLVGKIRKDIMFLSPDVAGSLANPEFIQLLIDHPNSVLIIEDAENIIMDRRNGGNTAVSNLLNISDGLLADFLNVQLVCTFNSSLTMIDKALLRKGRLIAQYRFDKLGIGKAQQLSDQLGFDQRIGKPMTIAEIAHQHEKGYDSEKVEVIGFRRPVMEN